MRVTAIRHKPPGLSVDDLCQPTRRSFLALLAALIGPATSAQDGGGEPRQIGVAPGDDATVGQGG